MEMVKVALNLGSSQHGNNTRALLGWSNVANINLSNLNIL